MNPVSLAPSLRRIRTGRPDKLGLVLFVALLVGVAWSPEAWCADPIETTTEAATTDTPAADASGPGLHRAVESLLAVTTILLVGIAGGIGIGAFGLVAHRVFRRRAKRVDRLVRTRPGLSLATGIAITIATLALLSIVAEAEGLPLLVLLAYGTGLFMFAATAAVRLAADTVDASPTLDDPMSARSAVSGGLLIVFMNALPILGSLLLGGILLAGVGAALLSYFASIGVAAAGVVGDDPKPAP